MFPRVLLIAFLLLFSGASAVAEEPAAVPISRTAEREAQEIFDTTMSPFCPGRTISACPSESARALRDDILVRLEHGESPLALRQELMDSYGQGLTGTPQGNAARIIGWAAPIVFLVAMAFLALRMLRRCAGNLPGSSAAPGVPGTDAVDESTARSIEAELKKRFQNQ